MRARACLPEFAHERRARACIYVRVVLSGWVLRAVRMRALTGFFPYFGKHFVQLPYRNEPCTREHPRAVLQRTQHVHASRPPATSLSSAKKMDRKRSSSDSERSNMCMQTPPGRLHSALSAQAVPYDARLHH